MLTEQLWAWGDRRVKDNSKLFGPSTWEDKVGIAGTWKAGEAAIAGGQLLTFVQQNFVQQILYNLHIEGLPEPAR